MWDRARSFTGIVDGYDDLHVRRARVMVLACHGHVERLGGMHPVFLVAARDGGDLARGGEGFGNTGDIIADADRL